MHSIIEPHYLLLRVYIVLLFLKGNNIQYHLYQIPLKLNVYIRYVFWAGGLALRNKVMLCCYVMLVVSEKIGFEFLYVHDLGPRSRNDLDLQYSHTFIKSFSCLYLPTFRSQASIVSEKFTVFTFSYRKAKVSKFDLGVK